MVCEIIYMDCFEEEATRLYKIFDSEIIDIDHIGSTSVNRLIAKLIIDIMPVVRDVNRIDDFNKLVVAIGYKTKGEYGISQRRYFQKGGDNLHFFITCGRIQMLSKSMET